MPTLLEGELTDRQRMVLEGIKRRQPLKVIAAELGISESRVNQHVKTLKDRYGVHNLADLVEAARLDLDNGSLEHPYRKPAWRKPQVPLSGVDSDPLPRVGPGEFVLSDIALNAIEAPWMVENEPRVVPGMLDGHHAVLFRLAVIVGIAFGLIAAVVLVVTASLTLSDMLEGSQVSAPASKEPAG